MTFYASVGYNIAMMNKTERQANWRRSWKLRYVMAKPALVRKIRAMIKRGEPQMRIRDLILLETGVSVDPSTIHLWLKKGVFDEV